MKPFSPAPSALVVASACAMFLLGSCASNKVTDSPPAPPVKEISSAEDTASRQIQSCLDFHRELDAKYKLGENFSELDASLVQTPPQSAKGPAAP